ncbi:DUF222 domain-containing protein [Arthrobacter sp. JZ12]|uniref:HNH endonuclease signature motif containing protein n=1 Tax=Arthrobacter sp. JZ12 TaxID=2654190 RepID=UPI002B45B35A|nr:DUF222 domain-containing protein [Arthrobacter sp. JZ12]WRH24397.1 DUF222 domain-containing protein [Arthrobacter sp. JZ12]
MGYSEGFAAAGGASGAGASRARSSAGPTDGWAEEPSVPPSPGQIWEGTDEPAPAGPWGVVELPVTSDLEHLKQAVDTLERLNQLQCWADAQKARLVERIRELFEQSNDRKQDPSGADSDEDFAVFLAAEEVGALLRIPMRTARSLVEQSRLLVQRHQPTLASLEDGKMSWRHASTVVEECVGVPADVLPDFEQDLVSAAECTTVSKLARRARVRRELLHPQAAPVRKSRAEADRRVQLEPDRDGMAWLSAYLPAEQACGIYNRLDAAARSLQCPDEDRTLTQLRADVFADLLTHTCTGNNDDGTGFRSVGATVHITVPAMTLLERLRGSEAGSCREPGPCEGTNTGVVEGAGSGTMAGAGLGAATNAGAGPGAGEASVLEGYGPIDADTAARLAGHASSFIRILTHPESGAPLSVGRTSYRPPKHLQDWVRARDRTCRHPGCNRTATASEIDHTVPWHQGGHTDHDNLACLCRRHHALKTNGHWRYSQPEPGTVTATSPAGKTYTTQPPPF